MIARVHRSGPGRRVLAVGLVAAVALCGGCVEQGLPPEEQRATMVAAGQAVVERVAHVTDAQGVEVSDDGSTLQPCAEGGSAYVYAATIGPVDRSGEVKKGTSFVLSGAVGSIIYLQDPEHRPEGFPRFGEPLLKEDRDEADLSMSYEVADGDDKGMTLWVDVVTTDDDEIFTKVRSSTRGAA